MRIYKEFENAYRKKKRLLAVLIDPEKFECEPNFAKAYLQKLPKATTHLFVGGSSDKGFSTPAVVKMLKGMTNVPVILFPGDYRQITDTADGILFHSLLSGNNPEFLIGQQTKAALLVKMSKLEVIPTGYLLIDGGGETSVERVSKTTPMSFDDVDKIVATALAGEFLGKKCIYLEAGSGAKNPVNLRVIREVADMLSIPLIVGGGIRSVAQMETAYQAGATMVVVGTAIEEDKFSY